MARPWHPSTSRGVSSLGEAAVHPQGGINASDVYDMHACELTFHESSGGVQGELVGTIRTTSSL